MALSPDAAARDEQITLGPELGEDDDGRCDGCWVGPEDVLALELTRQHDTPRDRWLCPECFAQAIEDADEQRRMQVGKAPARQPRKGTAA